MNIKQLYTVITLSVSVFTANSQTMPVYQDVNRPVEERVQDALSRMTLEEKCRIVYAQGFFSSPGVPRLGIPELIMGDSPSGIRPEMNPCAPFDYANCVINSASTAFPSLTCLAATWNKDLATAYGKNLGEEARYRKKNVLLGPAINIYRTPLNGRNFEYMGEDPYLSGMMAANYIDGVQSNGVSACLKHLALNNQEQFRMEVDVKVSDRALHEIYLAPFKIAIERSHPWSVMAAYNCYRGLHCCHNKYLLDDILKGDWKYEGTVMSDWGGTHNTDQAANYGLDIEMATMVNGQFTEKYDDFFLGATYLSLAKAGLVPMSVVDDKAGRVLRLIFLTAMNENKSWGSLNSPEHLEVARTVAEEGIILMKNDEVKINKKTKAKLLPIQPSLYKNILIVGENGRKPLTVGGGSSDMRAFSEKTAYSGIKERFEKECNIEYAQGYASGYPVLFGPAEIASQAVQDSFYADAIEKAKKADLIIYIGGLNKNVLNDSEFADRLSYELPYNQDKLITELVKIQPNMITVLFGGNSVSMPWLSKTPALVYSGYLGSESGNALATVLSGDVCPSGKTVFSFAQNLEDYPANQFGLVGYPGVSAKDIPSDFSTTTHKSWTGLVQSDSVNASPSSKYLIDNNEKLKKAVPEKFSLTHLNTSTDINTHWGNGTEVVVYAEDIFTGYRYFDKNQSKVLFPFGHGLSYTTFKYSDAKISSSKINDNDSLTVTVNITNTGKVEGKEVVQLYIGDDESSVARPVKELKGFEKVSLKPGETKTVSFVIQVDDLKFYDENAHKWTAEKGTFKAYICSSSTDIRAKIGFEY